MNDMCQQCGELKAIYFIEKEGEPTISLCISCFPERKIKEAQDRAREALTLCHELISLNDAANILGKSYCLGCRKKFRKMTDEEKQKFNETIETLTPENREFMKDIYTQFENEKIYFPRGGDDNGN